MLFADAIKVGDGIIIQHHIGNNAPFRKTSSQCRYKACSLFLGIERQSLFQFKR